MSLFVVFNDNQEQEIHIPLSDEKQTYGRIPQSKVVEVKMIQADGDELEAIIEIFRTKDGYTIPIPYGKRVVRWYGDIAKTILSNL